MDYGALPPEINSARMYFGPGSAPMLAAAAAWDGLAAELSSTASSYQSVIERLAGEGWLGPASASMAAAVTPYVTWVSLTAVQAERAATQASAAAGAYEAAFAMTVPPAAVAANRAQLAALVATNFLGQNTPAIAATEAHYGEMWAQDAAAMYGYAGNSAAASVLKPFTQPPQTTNPAGQAGQAAAVAQATATPAASGTQTMLTQLTSALPTALQSLTSPLAGSPLASGDIWSFLDSNFVNGFVSGGYINPSMVEPAIFASMADANAVALGAEPGTTALPPMGSGEGNAIWQPVLTPSPTVPFSSAGVPFSTAGVPGVDLGGVSAGMARGTFVGRLSVPQSWTAVTQVENHAGAALAGGGWTSSALPENSAGVPGVPGVPAASTAGRHFGSGPRYGFHVTVMPRPPAAG
jgi:PPE-repeat protein